MPYNLSALSCCDERQVEQMSPEEFDGHQVKGSELVCNNLVCAFEDCIGLWVGGTCNHCLYSIGLKEFLKLNSGEFGSRGRTRSDQRHEPRCGFLYPKQQST